MYVCMSISKDKAQKLESAIKGQVKKMDTFQETYRCYSAALMPSRTERRELLYGGKIILPQSALRALSVLDLSWPLQFQLTNNTTEEPTSTHCGVLEFTAEEGRVYLPLWMMQTLSLDEGDNVDIASVELQLGTYVKIQPQHVDFLDILDPKAALENALKNFSTLSEGDVFTFMYDDKLYGIHILETKPKGGVSVIETDLEVDFAPPVGYVEPVRKLGGSDLDDYTVADGNVTTVFEPYTGSGQNLQGTDVNPPASMEKQACTVPPALHLPPGRLFFGYPVVPLRGKDASKWSPFPGSGNCLT